MGITSEFHSSDRYGLDEADDGLENPIGQGRLSSEKQNVAHQGADGIGGGDRAQGVLFALLKQADLGNGSVGIGAGFGEFAGERRAVGEVLRTDLADVGNFVGQDNGVGGRHADQSGFAGAGNPGKEKSAGIANGAGGVELKSAFLGEKKRMGDAQDAIDGIGIGAGTNGAFAAIQIEMGAEIAAAQVPGAALAEDFDVGVCRLAFWREFDVEAARRLRVCIEESSVALLDYFAEVLVCGDQLDGDSADFDDEGGGPVCAGICLE